MLLKADLPRPPLPTTDEGLSAAGAGSERVDTADTEGSERRRITNREEAAKIIQRSWRKHIVRECYDLFKTVSTTRKNSSIAFVLFRP